MALAVRDAIASSSAIALWFSTSPLSCTRASGLRNRWSRSSLYSGELQLNDSAASCTIASVTPLARASTAEVASVDGRRERERERLPADLPAPRHERTK